MFDAVRQQNRPKLQLDSASVHGIPQRLWAAAIARVVPDSVRLGRRVAFVVAVLDELAGRRHVREVESLLDGVLEVGHLERLEDDLDCVGGQPTFLLADPVGGSGTHDDGNVLGRGAHAQLLEERPALELGGPNHQVQDDEVGQDLGDLGQVVRRKAPRGHPMPEALDDVPKEVEDLLGVVDDQDVLGLPLRIRHRNSP